MDWLVLAGVREDDEGVLRALLGWFAHIIYKSALWTYLNQAKRQSNPKG